MNYSDFVNKLPVIGPFIETHGLEKEFVQLEKKVNKKIRFLKTVKRDLNEKSKTASGNKLNMIKEKITGINERLNELKNLTNDMRSEKIIRQGLIVFEKVVDNILPGSGDIIGAGSTIRKNMMEQKKTKKRIDKKEVIAEVAKDYIIGKGMGECNIL